MRTGSLLFLRLLASSVVLAASAGATGALSTTQLYANDPCSMVSQDPGTPREWPEPAIAGRVWDATSEVPIEGATMRLYRCVDGAGVLEASTDTSDAGHYLFTGLSQAFYYVAAVMEGPLAGMAPAQGYVNPSQFIDVGDGDPGVDFSFQ
jgi:hypothetical protein